MSLYNMLMGRNPLSGLLLAMIDLSMDDVERFRDAYIDTDGPDPRIAIYTRTGGGNRDDYPNDTLTSSQYYISDCDDDFDCTYATYLFRAPEQHLSRLKDLVAMDGESDKPQERMLKLLNEMQAGDNTPHVQMAMKALEPAMEQLRTALESGESGKTITV